MTILLLKFLLKLNLLYTRYKRIPKWILKNRLIIDYINGYPVHQQKAIIKMELYELYNICEV